MKYYDSREFVNEDGSFSTTVLPVIVAEQLENAGYKTKMVKSIEDAYEVELSDCIPVFNYTYFSPKCYETGVMQISPSTYSIHHFAGSWLPKHELLIGKVRSWIIKKIPVFFHLFKKFRSLL